MSGHATSRLALVVMGVSGSGKTRVGIGIAARLDIPFVDGDDLHSAANVAKMHAGFALDDTDRAPWLDQIGAVLGDVGRYPAGVAVACSALRRAYRDRLRLASGGCRFLYLALKPEIAERRVAGRQGHFMPSRLVSSQFETLEPPTADETDVITLDAALPLAKIVRMFT